MNAFLITLVLMGGLAERPDLVGRVVASGDKPLAGAHVLIDSAGVRIGTSLLCPSCYADCRKIALTDQDGHFRIASVDPELVFNVLVVADGFQPTFAEKADPAREPIKVVLAPFDRQTAQSQTCVARGRARCRPPGLLPVPGSLRECSRPMHITVFRLTFSTPWP